MRKIAGKYIGCGAMTYSGKALDLRSLGRGFDSLNLVYRDSDCGGMSGTCPPIIRQATKRRSLTKQMSFHKSFQNASIAGHKT